MSRRQVSLPFWLDDYLIGRANKHNIKLSVLIQIELCIAAMATTVELHPEYELEIPLNQIIKSKEHLDFKGKSAREASRFLSKLMFEARKAVDYQSSIIIG